MMQVLLGRNYFPIVRASRFDCNVDITTMKGRLLGGVWKFAFFSRLGFLLVL